MEQQEHNDSTEQLIKSYTLKGGRAVRLLFYDIGSYGDIITEFLSSHVQSKEKNVTFCTAKRATIQKLKEDIKLREDDYIIFYLISSLKISNKIKKMLKDYKLNAKVVALCKNYQEGIKAIENGSDFALQLPLIKDKVIHCYEHLK